MPNMPPDELRQSEVDDDQDHAHKNSLVTCPVCDGRRVFHTIIGYGMGRNGQYKKWREDPCQRCEGSGKVVRPAPEVDDEPAK